MAVTEKNIIEEKSPFEDILTKFLNKRMEKVGKIVDSQAVEAVQSGQVPPTHVVSELIKQYSPDQESMSKLSIGPNQGMGKVNYNNQTGAVNMQNPNSIMQFLVGSGPLKGQLANLKTAQEIAGGGEGQETKDIYSFDPYTKQIEKTATVPKSAEVYKSFLSPEEKVELAKNLETIKRESPERVTMSSNLDVMDSLLTDMATFLEKDTMVMVKGLNPLAQREFKAIVDNYDKVAAIAAGGKQLTKTELDLIRNTRPTLLDTKNPEAIKRKFNIAKEVLGMARDRLNKSTPREKENENSGKTKSGNSFRRIQ